MSIFRREDSQARLAERESIERDDLGATDFKYKIRTDIEKYADVEDYAAAVWKTNYVDRDHAVEALVRGEVVEIFCFVFEDFVGGESVSMREPLNRLPPFRAADEVLGRYRLGQPRRSKHG